MNSQRGRLGWRGLACVGLLVTTGCVGGSSSIEEPIYRHTLHWIELSKTIEEAKNLETSAPDQSLLKYQQVVRSATIDHPYEYYQARLNQSAEAIQPSRPASEEEILGLIRIYEQKVRPITDARLGLARIYMNQQAYREARAEVHQAVKTMSLIGTAGGIRYLTNVDLLPEIFDLFVEFETRAGASGRVKSAKLNKQVLEEYGRSQLASSDRRLQARLREAQEDFLLYCIFYAEKRRCTSAVKLMKAAGATTGTDAPLPSQAPLARFQTELLGTASKGLDLWLTPWGIASFGLQLVDPRLGADTPGVVKTFASEAAALGNTAELAQSAQQVIKAVESFPTVQTTSDPLQRVGEFAEVFNAFLAQLQEIRFSRHAESLEPVQGESEETNPLTSKCAHSKLSQPRGLPHEICKHAAWEG